MESVAITLTASAIKEHRLDIHACGKTFFPADAIGSSSKKGSRGIDITLLAKGLPKPIKTDIPSDNRSRSQRWFFRERNWIGKFIKANGFVPGDQVEIRHVNNRTYELIPHKGQLTFIDLFAGIGGFRLAFEKTGYKCVFSSEIDKDCRKVYFENFGEVPTGDITKISSESIPSFDILLAGFPCQPFSISGKKRGFEDTRGTLFWEICRIIKDKSPEVILLENVQHLIHHDQGKTLKVILNSLTALGYKVDCELLNAKDFGVPQYRERIFIVGSKKGYFNFKKLRRTPTPKLKEFLDKDGDFEYLKESEYTLIEAPRHQESGLLFVGYRNKNTWKVGVRPNTEHLSRVHRQPNRIYSIEGTHPTIPSQETSGRFFIYDPSNNRVRKLTLNECYRLMGFPNTFIKHPCNGTAYKQIGNSVCVPLCQEVGRVIKSSEAFTNGPQGKAQRDLQLVLFG